MDLFHFLESLQYESRPYLYGSLSVYALKHSHASIIMLGSGVILALCSYIVFRMRYDSRFKYQKTQAPPQRRYK